MQATMTLIAGIQDYWTTRSTTYSQQNIEEMNSWKRNAWRDKILSMAPTGKSLDILDVGTGPGFFAVNLALAGHRTIGLDVTEEMLAHARQNAQAYGAKVSFIRQNGDMLPFADDSFDLVVSRNVLWNMEQPAQALYEWARVLRPGGRMVYFDANWYLYLFDPQVAAAKAENRRKLQEMGCQDPMHSASMPKEKVDMLEEIARNLPLSRENRPDWDRQVLRELGMQVVCIQEDISADVLSQRERLEYLPNPMFMVCAEKGGGGD